MVWEDTKELAGEVRAAQDRQLLQVRHVWQIAHQVVVSHLVVSV
jgi:hypothetical protein